MESPDSDLDTSTETDLNERVSILTCVPSEALNFDDWLDSDARFLVAFLIHVVAAVNIFAEVENSVSGRLGVGVLSSDERS